MFTESFSTNLFLALQQKGSRLRDTVSSGTHVGKMASPANYIKPVSMRAPEGRYAPIDPVFSDYVRRWVFPQERELPQFVDSFDQLQTIVDPKSQLVEGAANAAGRAWDDILISAAFASSYIGENEKGLSTETFDTTKYGIDERFGNGASAIGLTADKIIETQRIFRHNHVDLDMEDVTFIIGSQQEADLKRQSQLTSREFNDKPILNGRGQVDRWLGCRFIVSERLNFGTGIGGSANTRQCIAYVKSGLYLGMWMELRNDVDIRKDLAGHPWQVYSFMMTGATRLEPGRLLRVDCGLDTAGADNV
jgi:hypothetical protein